VEINDTRVVYCIFRSYILYVKGYKLNNELFYSYVDALLQ